MTRTPILVDSNVLIDIADPDGSWFEWSSSQFRQAVDDGLATINPLIYAEVAAAFDSPEELARFLSPLEVTFANLPYEAAFPASQAFHQYRRRGGVRTSPLPDFYIGAHALVQGLNLLTRDVQRYRTYFPQVELICPS